MEKQNILSLPDESSVLWDFFAISPKDLARFSSLCDAMAKGSRLTKAQGNFVDTVSDALAEMYLVK